MAEAVVDFASEPVPLPDRRQFVDLCRILAKLAIRFADLSDKALYFCPCLPFVYGDTREHTHKNNSGQENHSDNQRRGDSTSPPDWSNHHQKYSATHQRHCRRAAEEHHALTGERQRYQEYGAARQQVDYGRGNQQLRRKVCRVPMQLPDAPASSKPICAENYVRQTSDY